MKKHYALCTLGDTPRHTEQGFVARLRQCAGFTLTEVVLAVGVLSLAIVALVGLFGPTMGAVKEVVDRSGALAVADQVNAQLLSDEIYTALGTQNQASRFEDLSDWLLVRNGNSVDAVGTATPKGRRGILYAWKQFRPDRDQVSNVDVTLWPTVQTDIDRGSAFDLGALDGSVYLVVMERGLQQGSNTYPFGNVATSAYFPILVSIYEAPMNLITNNGGSDLSADDLKDYANGLRGKPLFQYTTAKLR